METHEFAQWMQDEHHKVEELMQAVRERVASEAPGGSAHWIADVRERFTHLRAHLLKHMAMEEKDGYLPSVVDRRPTLSGEVERLNREHGQLTRIMNGIQHTLSELTPQDRLLARDCCSRIHDLLSYLDHHEAHENLIVLSVFTNDIGTKD